ncbi:antitoxin [Caulobacter henricii]|nr:hypothetical protein [Caulobacter henricii]
MTDPVPEPVRATLFVHGRSQALHLPEDCRFEGVEVAIRREGAKVILEPITTASPAIGE